MKAYEVRHGQRLVLAASVFAEMNFVLMSRLVAIPLDCLMSA